MKINSHVKERVMKVMVGWKKTDKDLQNKLLEVKPN